MVGEELGNYRVVAPLGKGGMASVYVGEHRVLGHKVAIKILHPKHLANESIERRFFNEARAIASIRHPSVVELVDFGRAGDGRAYIVMELLEGESLRARIRSGIMTERAAAAFARQVASGLAMAHDRGIIHRDLKPDNVFLIRDPEVELGERAKVLDFGIAKQTEFSGPGAEHTATGILVGTPAYMSPEQCRGNGVVDARSDVYSLGVVLYRMVTNQLPFEASGTGELIGKHLYIKPKPPREINPALSEALNSVVVRCLEKEASRRYQDMRQVADALAATAAQQPRRPLPVLTSDDVGETQVVTPSQFVSSSSRHAPPPVLAGAADVTTRLPLASKATPAPPTVMVEETLSPFPGPLETMFDGSAVDEETHPTTLRTATGESARRIEPRRRVLALAVVGAAALITLIVLLVGSGAEGDQAAVERDAEAAGATESAPVETAPEPATAAAAAKPSVPAPPPAANQAVDPPPVQPPPVEAPPPPTAVEPAGVEPPPPAEAPSAAATAPEPARDDPEPVATKRSGARDRTARAGKRRRETIDIDEVREERDDPPPRKNDPEPDRKKKEVDDPFHTKPVF